jgi:hypothetical protein
MRLRAILAVAAVATCVATTSASAATLIGCRSVNFLADNDVISASGGGPFKAIQLRVSGNGINMRDLKVIYGNGVVDDLRVRSNINAGGQTRWIDLKGQKRQIKQIRMSYASKLNFKGLADVCAYGR